MPLVEAVCLERALKWTVIFGRNGFFVDDCVE